MRPQFNTSLTRLIIVGELILVVYLLYTLTVSVYKSYQLDQIISEYQNENTHIEQQNKQKKSIKFNRSFSYICSR